MNAISPVRHPWFQALESDQLGEMRALIDGYASVAPWERAEPQDAAAAILSRLPEGDRLRTVFDSACLEILKALREEVIRPPDERRYRAALGSTHRLLAVIRRTKPKATLSDMHRRYAYWFAAFEAAAVPDGVDLRHDFLQVLALTQFHRGAGQPQRLMALWLDVCAESGSFGRYPLTYLDVGMLGLRRMPLAEAQHSQEEAVCHGLARWAARQQPDRALFLQRWREIESAFPRSPTWWAPVVEPVILAVEAMLAEAKGGDGGTFAAAGWWREDVELPAPRIGSAPPVFARRRMVEPPPEKDWRLFLEQMHLPIGKLRSGIQRLMERQEHYAEVTGDTFYIVRTACNLGMRLIKKIPAGEADARGELGQALARTALRYQPANVYGWALWRDSLEARGAHDAAEALGWETIRRFPEDNQWRNQLAKLLAGARGRPAEAAALLRQTLALFPDDNVARVQLASLPQERPGAVVKQPHNQLADPGFGLGGATARRALFRAEVAPDPEPHLAEIRRLLSADPALAYLRYAAQRSNAAESLPWRDTAFAFAFARAAREGSAAAMRALTADWPGILEQRLVSQALIWMNAPAGNHFYAGDAGTTVHYGSQARFDVLLAQTSRSAVPPVTKLLLLADFAAADLSLAQVA